MRKSSSVALPAFIKPLINEMAGTGLHIDHHAAIPDIQHGVEECDRKHYSDKCYLISAALGTVVQVCHVIYEQSGRFSLILMVFMSGILPAGSIKPTFCRISTFARILLCIPLTSPVVSGFWLPSPQNKKKSSSRVTQHAPV